MNTVLFDDIAFKLDTPKIAKKLHVDTGSDEYSELTALLEEASAIAKPKAAYKPVFIEDKGSDFVLLDNQKMISKVVSNNLKNIHRVFAFVSTCGEEIEQYSKTVTDYLHSWWMNSIMEMILKQASDYLRYRIKKDFDIKKLASMNPGSLPDWPINEQPKLFSLLGNVKDMVGVTLTDSMLMIPAKTVSGFYFETETDYVNCQLCARKNCPNRKQPFDSAKYKAVFDG